MVCGSSLEYLDHASDMACTYCGRVESGHITCLKGHYVCDACHNKGAMEAIEEIVFTTTSQDPMEIAELMMAHPGLPMLGCQHAYIAAGALLSALRNEGSRAISDTDIQEVFKRIDRQAIGGYCGLTGVCGIAPAIGACFAVLLGSKCGMGIEQKITMDAATAVSKAIADITGPSCCKAYVRAALAVATDLLKERFGIVLPVEEHSLTCTYVAKHPHGCRMEKCPYFGENRRLVKEAVQTGEFFKADC